MKKLRMQSPDVVSDNIRYIAERFPNCLIESNDENGKPIQVIDFDQLRQELLKDIVEGPEERYQFTWPDKRNAIRLANTPTTDTLRPCREESVDFDNTQNLYIEGDNLEVLKLLREDYLGKVKMIYIDPPYNTGNDFVYNDDFAQISSEYVHNSGQEDEEGNRLVTNTESNGRFHTDWLNMMYPRLKVAKDLLTEDGVIFISIDDNEISNLLKICNEIFGEQNFVGNIIWQSRTSISNDDEISTNHNHTLVYSRYRELLTFGGDDIDETEYVNQDNDPRGPWKLVPIDANHVGGDTRYPIRNPKTGIDYYPPNGRIWCYNKKTLEKLIEDNRIKFGLSDDSSPKRKLYLNERKEKGDSKTPSSILLNAGTTKTGTTEIMNLFENEKVFDYPKPTTLISRLMQYGFVRDNDLILDFFSGSGTTAHAMWEYSAKEKCYPSFILVQIPENLDKTLKTANSDARKTIKTAIAVLNKLGYPHLLTEIAKERIRRAGKKIKEELAAKQKEAGLFDNDDKDKAAKLDIGFRVLKLDSSNMNDVFYTPNEFSEQTLFDENIKSDRADEDLLFQTMLDLGIELSAKIDKKQVAGKNIYVVSDGYLIACFDAKVDEAVITKIAKLKPYYFVMRDSSLEEDNVADNFDQIFDEYSKDTIRKIL
jgi:Adenine specific DNA methylase Mod